MIRLPVESVLTRFFADYDHFFYNDGIQVYGDDIHNSECGLFGVWSILATHDGSFLGSLNAASYHYSYSYVKNIYAVAARAADDNECGLYTVETNYNDNYEHYGSLNDHRRDGWYYYYTGNDYGNTQCGLFAAHTDNVTSGYYAGSHTN